MLEENSANFLFRRKIQERSASFMVKLNLKMEHSKNKTCGGKGLEKVSVQNERLERQLFQWDSKRNRIDHQQVLSHKANANGFSVPTRKNIATINLRKNKN